MPLGALIRGVWHRDGAPAALLHRPRDVTDRRARGTMQGPPSKTGFEDTTVGLPLRNDAASPRDA
jgi:hypothetical protein